MDARLDKDQVRRAYRLHAPTYDLWSRLAESRARQRCLELAGIRNGDCVLEVAVGTGLLFEQILRRNPDGQNEGIDLSEPMLARARARARRSGAHNYLLRIGDAYSLESPDNAFDTVINNYMFDLIPERDFATVLGEFLRVLRPGGRLVLASMTRGSDWFNAGWDWLYRHSPTLLGGCRGIELAPELERAGFRDVRREYLSQLGFPSEILVGFKPDITPM